MVYFRPSNKQRKSGRKNEFINNGTAYTYILSTQEEKVRNDLHMYDNYRLTIENGTTLKRLDFHNNWYS